MGALWFLLVPVLLLLWGLARMGRKIVHAPGWWRQRGQGQPPRLPRG